MLKGVVGPGVLTPAHEGEPEHVSTEVRGEHPHDAQVHVQGLKPRPSEGRQQEVVQEEGGAYTQPGGGVER